eukprot:412451_1
MKGIVIQRPKNSQANNRQSRKVYEGLLFKQGRINRSWKSRWFVLYNTRKLAYYNDKKESVAFKPISEIDLSKVDYIQERGKEGNKHVFEVVTGGRTYVLACLDTESLNL